MICPLRSSESEKADIDIDCFYVFERNGEWEPCRLKITVPYHQVQLVSKRGYLTLVFAIDQFDYFGWNEPVAEEEREARDWGKRFLVVAATPSLIFLDAVVYLAWADGWGKGGGIKDVGVYLVTNLSWQMDEVTPRSILCLHHFWCSCKGLEVRLVFLTLYRPVTRHSR